MIGYNFTKKGKVLSLVILFFTLINYCAFGQDKPTEDKKNKGVNIFITQSPKIIVKLEAVTHNTCYDEKKGAINISASGGYPPYKYYWVHGDTTQDVAGLKAGTYRVAVYDGFSCSDTISVQIKSPEKLMARVVSTKDISCYGYNHGAIDIDVKGGVAPYTYRWSNGVTTQDLQDVNSGRYSVLITDANNCQEIITADIKEKPLIVRSLDDISNIKCNGDSTGRIDLTVTGGSPPYAYEWSNGSTTQDLQGLMAGTYEVIVKDSEACTEVSSIKVIEPEKLSIGFDEVRNLRCNGDFGGAININVTGGTHPFKYNWNNGETIQDIAGISAGNYEVKVVDANACATSIQTEITEPQALIVNLKQSKNVSFYGGENGSIDIEVSGGNGPYKYKWSNEASSQDISGLKAGNYSVRVTDKTGCAKIMNVTISQPQPLVVRLDDTSDINCHGENTGAINISVFGGVAPYKYSWSNNSTSEDIANIPAGDYSVVVEDANGHKKTIEASIVQPPLFKASVVKTTDILCNGNRTGAIDITVEGGVMPYQYRWSNGYATQDLGNIPAGNYSVKITDANQCELELTASITEPEPLQLSFKNITNVLCNSNSTGAIDIDVVGGVAPYQYAWSNEATTQDISNLVAGTYTVKVTDKNGCSNELTTRISEPSELLVSEKSVQNIDCKGNNTGSISLNVSGGVVPYQYAWNTGATTMDIANIKAGSYSIKVTDANGCVNSFSKTITEPEKLVKNLVKVTDILCFGDAKGAVDINVSGGITPYKYQWSNGATTQDIIDIKAGDYFVNIKDANGCVDSLQASISQNTLLAPSLEASDIKCNGTKSGTIDLSVGGGVAPYTYKWSNGATTQDISNLTAGNYSVVITDAKGCSKSLDARISEPTRFIATLESQNDVKCYGDSTGFINIRINGGVQPYTYKWSNGATTQNVRNLPAGTYSLTATDANGCAQTLSTTLVQPTKIEYAVKSVSHVDCNGDKDGAIDITVIGGIGPYAYKWNNDATTQDLVGVGAGKYVVNIKEANGCTKTLSAEITQPDPLMLKLDEVVNIMCFGQETGSIDLAVKGGTEPYKYSWSNGAVTQDISKLTAGVYAVTVVDAKGCSKSISANVKQPQPLEAQIENVNQISCFGDLTGAISIQVKGGAQPYKYKWSNGSTTQNLTKLPAGTYSVSITDNNGCTQSLSATISQPSKLNSELTSIADVKCYNGKDGAINITVNGGIAPYKYAWNNGSTTQDLQNIPVGTYSVRIIDSNGCKDSIINQSITQPSLLTAQLGNVTHITQYGKSSGAVDISVSGGVAPYQYSWSNGAATQDIKAIPAGNYSVMVIDANGCEKEVQALVKQPSALEVVIASLEEIQCSGQNSGAITLDVKGGVSPYTFKWSNGDSTQNIKNVPAGDYSVKVKDANGHIKELKTKINQPTPLTIQIDEIQHILCHNDSIGSINVTVTGGNSPYKYLWNTGSTKEDVSGLKAGSYELVVTDAKNCSSQLKVDITQPDQFMARVANVKQLSCKGDNAGEIQIEVTGGIKPYNFVWNNGARTKDVNELIAGNYSVIITDANGCSNTVNAAIKEPTELLAKVTETKDNLCFGDTKGSVSIDVKGGTAPYNYAWSNGSSSQNLTGVPKGDYEVTITDSNGCTKTLVSTIKEPKDLITEVADIMHINCFGDKKGSVSVNVSGGIEPYSYLWNSGATSQDLRDVAAGNYQLAVKDANGCTKTITTEINQPQPLAVVLDTIRDVACFGDNKGLIDITASGGVFPYQYAWSNGDVSEDLVNVLAGKYTVDVTDANGCVKKLSANVDQPTNLTVTLDSLVNITCSGDKTGKVSITAHGGVAPYNYQWSNGYSGKNLNNVAAGRYTAKITDKNGCTTSFETEITEPPALVKTIDAITDIRCYGENTGSISVTVMDGVFPYTFKWNNGETTEDIYGIVAGDYKLTITEANGCESVLEATIEEPAKFQAKVEDVASVDCYDDMTGAIDIDVRGGVEPYTYAWSNGSTEQDIDSLGADSYAVMIHDGNGCLNILNADIVQPPKLYMAIDSVKNVKCCGDDSGAIYISVEGGVEPYDYLWSNGATTQDIEHLVLGKYTVNVTDANGCMISSIDDMNLYEQVVSTGKFTTRGILFDTGKSTIKPESFPTINRIASFMKEHADIAFRIDGHTDSDGSADMNQKLSEDRSEAIKRALIKFGIRESRIKTKGYGESTPIATNATADGKSLNRRVEFVALTGTLKGTLIENEESLLEKEKE